MLRRLIGGALDNPMLVIVGCLALIAVGIHSCREVNVEAYPDPAPAIIEIIAQYPGASAEEVERLVTIPLEVTFSGMPKLKYLRTKSLFGLSHLRLQFDYGYTYADARQEVVNRISLINQPLPTGVTPQLSPESPTGEIYRYTLRSPKDEAGNDIYSLNDLKALQDWVLERAFRRVPRIVDVTSRGGTIKRYEVHLDYQQIIRLGLTLNQVQSALANANLNVGADFVIQGPVALNVRAVGLIGGGMDPTQKVLGLKDPDPALAAELVDIEKEGRAALCDLYEKKLRLDNAITRSLVLDSEEREFLKAAQAAAELERLVGELKEKQAQRAKDGQEPDPDLAKQLAAVEEQMVSADRRIPDLMDKPWDREMRRLRATENLLIEEERRLRELDQTQLTQEERTFLDYAGRRIIDEVRRLRATEQTQLTQEERKFLDVASGIQNLKEEERKYLDVASRVEKLREEQTRRTAKAAVRILREEENKRILELRQLVITSVNNTPILLGDVVVGGRLKPGEVVGERGVVVGHQTRLGRSGLSVPKTVIVRDVDISSGKTLSRDEDDKVECIVLLRKDEYTLPALADVRKTVEELNNPRNGRLLPGVFIETYYDRNDLVNVTTDTVKENLLLGMMLVTVILLMFLSNVRGALIVAINIPLALLFAFTLLYARGKSANLLSIGAVDFGIIVDSSVIIIENVYRKLCAGEHADLPLKQRILDACLEVQTPLLFSTLIIVCAFLPLFTMSGPEGQIFGPMADTYAFALGGALLLATTVSPVLAMFLFKHLKPGRDNRLVRWLKSTYLQQLEFCLNHRVLTLTVFGVIIGVTVFYVVPRIGREFMPELEEGNLWIRGTFPLNTSLENTARNCKTARSIMGSYPEVNSIVAEIGRPDDGTDPTGFYNAEFFVPLRPEKDWPEVVEQTGWRRWLYGEKRRRTKVELVKQMNDDLNRDIPGTDWNFSQNIRDNVMEALSGVKGDNSVKIFGPDLKALDDLAVKVRNRLQTVRGIQNVGIFSIKGQTNLEFCIDKEKCKKWGVSAADVINALQSAIGGKACSSMVEGERTFDITIRLPQEKRRSALDILDLPVDIINNTVVRPSGPGIIPSSTGTGQAPVATIGSRVDTTNPITNTAKLRLRELVTPVGLEGVPDPTGRYERSGASTIYREQGNRMVAIKFSVITAERDLASAVAEAKDKTRDLFDPPYHAEWSGEFQEMEEAEAKLMLIVPASLILIFMFLYMAFSSVLDACLVLMNVVALSLGGIWALYLTDTHFSISAAVGFISIFGVGIMDGLMLVSYFNTLRAHGVEMRTAIMQGAEKRVRPVMMTDLTAIFGLLPAAMATRIGSQTQKPLAIVVVGGMTVTLLLARYLLPVLYSYFGNREPPAGSGSMAH